MNLTLLISTFFLDIKKIISIEIIHIFQEIQYSKILKSFFIIFLID